MADERTLLSRQTRLVEFLTTPEAYEGGAAALALYPGLEGLDAERLALLARLTLAKRMEKIAAVLPRTLRLLDGDGSALARAFASRHPPRSPSRLENARQFHDFLEALWRETPPAPPWLADLAAFEITYAAVRFADEEPPRRAEPDAPTSVRLRPSCALLRCDWDIRPLFDEAVAASEPNRRALRLAIARPDPEDGPRVFEIDAGIFAWLGHLGDWRPFAGLPPPGGPAGAAALAAELAARGILEVTA